jgi:hypothetical protein
MKKCGIIAVLFLIAFQVKADIIEVPHRGAGADVSVGVNVGVEKPFTKHNSANFWGGFGAVSVIDAVEFPAPKGEVGVEIKHYFSKDKYGGFNVGLYSLLAFLNAPAFGRNDVPIRYEKTVGFVPGLKLSYLYRGAPLFQLEPYVGVSTPFYEDSFEDLINRNSNDEPGFMLTLGFIARLNKILH